SKIPPRCRIQSHYVSPKGCIGCIERKDFIFAVAPFKTHGAQHLHELLTHGAWWIVTAKAHYLHRECAGSTHHFTRCDVLIYRANKRWQIYSVVVVEVLVFKEQQCCFEFIAHRVGVGKTPLTIICDNGTQQFSIARIEHSAVWFVK